MTTPETMDRVLSFLCMITGMYAVQFYSNVQQFDESAAPVPVKRLLFQSCRDAKFWMAIAVSPIIFYPTCLLVGQLKDELSLCTASFQNGFFWITIFNAAVSSRKKDQKPANPKRPP